MFCLSLTYGTGNELLRRVAKIFRVVTISWAIIVLDESSF